MPFIPESEIQDYEILYRAIHPHHWEYDEDRPTSAAFKDKQGVSTDRDGERPHEECLAFLLNGRENYGSCSIKAEEAKAIDVFLKPDKLAHNDYHSLILESETKIHISNAKAKQLCRTSKVHSKPTL
jgi:hypothetical protein